MVRWSELVEGYPLAQRVSGQAPSLAHVLSAARDAVRPVYERPVRRIRAAQQRSRGRFTRVLRPLAFLSFLGPGLIAAAAGDDAGGILTYASDGAQYGYNMLWMLVLVTISLMVVQEMCARMGAATNKGLSDLIRERFGVRGAAFAMLTLLIANTLITISEFAGIAAVANIFGISAYILVPVSAFGVWLLVARGSYSRVEKVFLAMTFAFFAYPIAAILAHPDWGQIARQTITPQVHWSGSYLLLFVGTVGTTITPYMQLYLQSSVAEKGVDMEHYRGEKMDAYVGAIFGDVIAAFIIIATGATVFIASRGVGVQITSAEQAAQALVPFLGRFAALIFAIGLLGASVLAAAVLPLTTSYAVTESFGFERGVSHGFREAPIFNGIFTGMLLLGAVVALIPGLPLVQLIVLAQAINGILLPILLVFMLMLVNDRRIMGKYVNSRTQNIIAWATTILLSVLCFMLILSTILPALGIPFLQ